MKALQHLRDVAVESYIILKSHLRLLIRACLFAPAHLCSYLLLVLHVDHVPDLVLLRHSGGPGLDHLLCLCCNCVPNLLLLCHDNHYRRKCEAFVDGAKHLGLVRLSSNVVTGVNDMYAWTLKAHRACLLLTNAGRNKNGKGGWE